MATTTHAFRVRTMHCEACATLIDDTLRVLPGVRDARVTAKTRDIRVELDPRQTSPDAVEVAVTELGFHVQPSPAPPTHPATPVEPQISDSAWRLVEPLLRDRRSRRPARVRDHRQLFEGIAYKHRNGVPWREVPTAFGPWPTLYARWSRWRADGTWAKVVVAVRQAGLDELAWVGSAG